MIVFIGLTYIFSVAGELSILSVIVAFLIAWIVFPILSLVAYFAVRDFIKKFQNDNDVLRW